MRDVARDVYERFAFAEYPVLVDALLDAGADSTHPVVRHLRGELREVCSRCDGKGGFYAYPPDDPTNRLMHGSHWYTCPECEDGLAWTGCAETHVRGCWAIDLLLGRE